eukprot:scaffold135417_cov142-Phaeocystis_antarctica.AAC.2
MGFPLAWSSFEKPPRTILITSAMPILPSASPLASAASSRTSAPSRVVSDSAAMRSDAASSCTLATTLVARQCSVSTSKARS